MTRPPARASAKRPAQAAGAKASRLQMADIARLAGVSASTVSRALAGSPLVNEETRRRVVDLATNLDYTINAGAQSLRLGQNRTIAVVVPYDSQSRQHLSDPFFLGLIGGLADAITERGYEMLLSRVDAERLDRSAQSWQAGRAAGLVLVGQWHHHDQLNELALRGVPMVVWGAQLTGQHYATVGSDNLQGGALVTEHLLQQGARQIAFFGDIELPEIALRHDGYVQALAQARRKRQASLVRSVPFVEDAIEAETRALCESGVPFDAIFAASDLMAMTIVRTLRLLGREVPRDILVAGYDDIDLARHFHPPLTTVRQPIAEAGRELVDELLSQLRGREPRSRLLATTLQVRETSVR